MMEMGHGDVMIFADANYPAQAHAKRLLRLQGVEIPALLDAVMTYFPLDSFVSEPVRLMNHLPEETVPEIWREYRKIIERHDAGKVFQDFGFIDRLPFYRESQNAYAIVQTSTTARYANIMLQKGVI